MSEAVVVVVDKEIEHQNNVKKKMSEIKEISSFLGSISLIFGVIYTFCLYQNPSGITYPIFVAAVYASGIIILNKLKMQVKKQSWFLVGVSVLIACSTCRTGDMFIIHVNRIAIFLMACIFMIHQFYDDSLWDFGKYIHSIVLFLITAITLIGYPFRHAINFFRQLKCGRFRHLALVGIGVGSSLPLIIILLFLLNGADAVFYNIVKSILDSFLSPWTLISTTVKTMFGALAFYCLVSGAYVKNLAETVVDRRKQEPLIAISGLTAIAIMYIVFCLIQIVYLFLGSGKLPEGMSYSSYARQGFFQLVFVVCLNLAMVLLVLKYFKKSKILNVILSMIGGCTFIMIASAAYRMLLYVGEYHLTYLRLLVLWFLAMVTVLMMGVMVLIFNNKFPLFRFSLITVSVCYLALAWIKPDAVIAQYNIANIEEDRAGLDYVTHHLSVDALPAVMTIKDTLPEDWIKEYYDDKVYPYVNDMGFRSFNFSYAKALAIIKEK